jgi:tRNA(Ile)-lysidine synthetase-like protein
LPARASLNAVVWDGRPLFVRSLRPGDRMAPFGMRGSKKLQDILVDAKVPRAERARLPLFECGGEIVWVPGYRVAASWAVIAPKARNLQLTMARSRGRAINDK